jgi:hypothetical protein
MSGTRYVHPPAAPVLCQCSQGQFVCNAVVPRHRPHKETNSRHVALVMQLSQQLFRSAASTGSAAGTAAGADQGGGQLVAAGVRHIPNVTAAHSTPTTTHKFRLIPAVFPTQGRSSLLLNPPNVSSWCPGTGKPDTGVVTLLL